MIAVTMNVYITFALLLLSCFVPTTLGKEGYAITFYYPQPPVNNCTTEFLRIRDVIYPNYIREMVNKTDVNFEDVEAEDPSWDEEEDEDDDRRLRSKSARRRVLNHQNSRRLGCNSNSCKKNILQIIQDGCYSYCYRRQLGSSSDSFERPDYYRPYGNRTYRVRESKGQDIVRLFYQKVDLMSSTDPCRPILNTLLYQIDVVTYN